MSTKLTRCEGTFLGHAIASEYDPSVSMALNISHSLIERKGFDGPDILSRHLYLYHSNKCEIGEVTKYIYQEALQQIKGKGNLTREDFLFDQTLIDEFVKIADKKSNGQTSSCGPAQRSYPLALCPWISDDDLYDFTRLEAKLTHYSPLAGEVAGIVNRICRSLLKNESWSSAVSSAFGTPRLHLDITAILGRHHRFLNPAIETHAAYAPTVLNAALHHVANSSNAAEAIARAHKHEKDYCGSLVGILAGARWGIPIEMFQENVNDDKIKSLRETASVLSNLWKAKLESPTN